MLATARPSCLHIFKVGASCNCLHAAAQGQLGYLGKDAVVRFSFVSPCPCCGLMLVLMVDRLLLFTRILLI